MRCACLMLMLTAAVPVRGQEADVRPDLYRAEMWLAAGVSSWDPVGRTIRLEGHPAPTHPALIALGSALGWGVGAAAGGFLGYQAIDRSQDLYLTIGTGTILGVMAGGSLGAPLGAHLTNRRRGALGVSLLASAGVQALTFGVASGVTSNAGINLLLATPVLQTVLSTAVEYRSSL